MLYSVYEKAKKEEKDFYEKHKKIFTEYDKLRTTFSNELHTRLLGYIQNMPVKGKDEYECEKEVDLKNYELVSILYIPEKDLVRVAYRGTWTDADTRYLFVEPESIDITP